MYAGRRAHSERRLDPIRKPDLEGQGDRGEDLALQIAGTERGSGSGDLRVIFFPQEFLFSFYLKILDPDVSTTQTRSLLVVLYSQLAQAQRLWRADSLSVLH
jgi:hypothetical protein